MTTKSAEALSAVAARGAVTIRELATKVAGLDAENAELRAKVASFEREGRLRALAREMDENGLSPELTFEEKVASLAKYPDLDTVENAIKLAGGGRLSLPGVADDAVREGRDAAAEAFAAFCLTGQGRN